MSLRRLLSLLPRLAPFVLILLLSIGARAEDGVLKLVLIVSRHGVRAPLDVQQEYAKYAAQPWPKWDVPAGYLTLQGRKQMQLMGTYYRERYISAGLLSGRTADDAPAIFLRANNLQRTIETARALGEALAPGASLEIHARPAGEIDPLFRPASIPLGNPDRELAAAAVRGRVGNDLHALELARRGAFAQLQHVLLGDGAAVPAGKTALLDLPAAILPGSGDNAVTMRGALSTAGSIIDSLMLQYAEGRPMSEVGWGRLAPEQFTALLELHSLWFELVHGTLESAQIEGSNLASHIGDTLEQAATGRPVAGAFGAPGEKLVVIAGHDTNQISLGSLFRLTWSVPGTQRNPVLLCGALVFELRERASDHHAFVRILYIAPSLEQAPTLAPLSLEHPPAVAPIFIPGCSEATPGFDAPLARFEALLRRVVDPQFVAAGVP
jgi:4-phytase / acid phosphatase